MPLSDQRRPPAGRAAVDGLATEVLTDVAALEGIRSEWDELAVAASRPYCAPGWALPWWERMRPVGSGLRVVTVRRGAELVGLAPCYVIGDGAGLTICRVLGDTASSYSELLAVADLRGPVAAAVAAALDEDMIDVLSLSGVPHDGPWPGLLREVWPGHRPHLSLVETLGAPYVDLPPGGSDAWFDARSRNFRQQVRRRKREFLRQGGRLQRAETRGDALGGLQDLVRLHHGRWAGRGGSQALHGSMTDMLVGACRLLGPHRLQVWTAAVDGRTVAAALFMAAGQEMHYWLGGFDGTWAPLSPSVLLLVEAVLHAPESGCRRVSFGPGTQPYKHRLATGEEKLLWLDLLPRSRRYPYVRLCQAPYRMRRILANRTPPETKQALRVALQRLRPVRRERPGSAGAGDCIGTTAVTGD